jgi:hypothetical protein
LPYLTDWNRTFHPRSRRNHGSSSVQTAGKNLPDRGKDLVGVALDFAVTACCENGGVCAFHCVLVVHARGPMILADQQSLLLDRNNFGASLQSLGAFYVLSMPIIHLSPELLRKPLNSTLLRPIWGPLGVRALIPLPLMRRSRGQLVGRLRSPRTERRQQVRKSA